MTNDPRHIAQEAKTLGEDSARRLAAQPPLTLGDRANWNETVSRMGGVYALWRRKDGVRVPVYVGETCNLWDRICEITQEGRHGAFRKFLDPGQESIRGVALKLLTSINLGEITWLELPIGRKETEEYLNARWRKTIKSRPSARFAARPDAKAYRALADL